MLLCVRKEEAYVLCAWWVKFEAAGLGLPTQASMHTCVSRHHSDWCRCLVWGTNRFLFVSSFCKPACWLSDPLCLLCWVCCALPLPDENTQIPRTICWIQICLAVWMRWAVASLWSLCVFAGWTLFGFSSLFTYRNGQFRGRRLANNHNIVFYISRTLTWPDEVITSLTVSFWILFLLLHGGKAHNDEPWKWPLANSLTWIGAEDSTEQTKIIPSYPGEPRCALSSCYPRLRKLYLMSW